MDIYICHTYYHLLVALEKSINNKIKPDLLLSGESNNNNLVKNNDLLVNLKKSGIFNKIYCYDFSDLEYTNDKYIGKIKKKFQIRKRIKNENLWPIFRIYSNIYIFNDSTILGLVLNYKKLQYILLEDGVDCFANYIPNEHTSVFQKFRFKMLLSYPPMGVSKNIIYIEVNNISLIKYRKKRLIEFSKTKLEQSLDISQKNIISEIFLDRFDFSIFDNVSLVLTQPLSEDHIVDSEETKIRLYKEAIKELPSNEKIIIKTHPRETTNYTYYFRNAFVIKKPFPVEILGFTNKIKINYAITIFSTSIFSITFVEKSKKIFLGKDWMNNKLSEIRRN